MTRSVGQAARVTAESGRIDDRIDGASRKAVPPGRKAGPADIADLCVQRASDDPRQVAARTPIVDGAN